MPILSVQTPRAQVSLRSERLAVAQPDVEPTAANSEIPLAELERAVFAEGVHVSTPALCELLRRKIPVTFLAWNGSVIGSFEPPSPPRGATRQLQYQLSSSPAPALALASKLIHAKIANSRRLLQRVDANHHRLEPERLQRIEACERNALRAADVQALLGYEGTAAALFYDLWAKFLPPDFPFGGRSTRPPGNPVNACLSYLSAIIYGELLSACVVRGLDPALGCLHQAEDGRWSLPLDLMEPFRPAIVEALTLRLFSHRILQGPHFETRDAGVWLNVEGRRLLIRHYEQRMQREFFCEQAARRTTMRQQLQDAALMFKLALGSPDTYAPFRVN